MCFQFVQSLTAKWDIACIGVIGQCATGPSGSASERFTAVLGRDYAHGLRSISGTVAGVNRFLGCRHMAIVQEFQDTARLSGNSQSPAGSTGTVGAVQGSVASNSFSGESFVAMPARLCSV
jgi:hypothetical protein